MKNEDHTYIMYMAFRYALGRRSTAPVTVQEYIAEHLDEFDKTQLRQMVKEIKDAKHMGALGDPRIDEQGWLDFAELLQDQI